MQLKLHEKIFLLIASPAAVILITAAALFFTPQQVSDASVSGKYWRSQTWSGEIIVTGDVTISRNLTIQPGTTVKFLVQDDQQSGSGGSSSNPDPNRTEEYAKSHSMIHVKNNFTSLGTADEVIVFTSAAEQPSYADWEAIYYRGVGSEIKNTDVSYSRDGIRQYGAVSGL